MFTQQDGSPCYLAKVTLRKHWKTSKLQVPQSYQLFVTIPYKKLAHDLAQYLICFQEKLIRKQSDHYPVNQNKHQMNKQNDHYPVKY